MMNCWKNMMKFRKKSAMASKKDLIVNLYTMKNIKKIKRNLMREKPRQLFIVIKHQKKVLSVFVYR